MPIDREKILQAAQRYVDKKRYDRAIVEYQRIIEEDPNDARTLLKIGDLQARMGAYVDAIGTYDQVGQYYSTQGFALKAIAVYKQIRELIRKQAPDLADRYSHIVPKLAEIYTQLGLTSDALAAFDEVATRLQRQGKEQEAIEVFRQMVGLDQSNPLPYLRLAEACCRVHSLDEAIDSFWRAAELLLGMNRPDDALKVIERILHFRQDPRYARVAAELYLARGQREDGLQALAKLQICFQADPKNIETLNLLAQAFTIIGQEAKAIEVYKEMARLAREQNRADLHRDLLAHLRNVAPNDEQVRAMESIRPSEHPPPRASYAPPSSVESLDDEAVLLDSIPPEPASAYETAASVRSTDAPQLRAIQASAPDVVVVDDDLQPERQRGEAGQLSTNARAQVRKALIDAESFRKLKLYGKAVEALHIALEVDPSALDVRLKLREVLIEAGDREGAIQETINVAMIYLDGGDPQNAEPLLYEVLEVEPQHPEALALLEQIVPAQYDDYGDGETIAVPQTDAVYRPDEPLPSYDVEEISAAHAIPTEPEPAPAAPSLERVDAPFGTQGIDDPFGQEAPLPSFPLAQEDDLMAGLDETALEADLSAADDLSEFAQQEFDEAIEEALEEADFFVTRGLYDDARSILAEQLTRSPNHPLLVERLREVEEAQISAGASRTIDRSMLDAASEANAYDDRAFDIAASLDALDQLDPPPSSMSPEALTNIEDEADVDLVFEKFKAGVASQISENDSATHYNLGIAYKEMGLFSDAVNEFTLAARDPAQECMCYAMVGMIHLEQGDLDKAQEAYLKALDAAHKTVEQEMGLYYDLGAVNEMKGVREQALHYFQKISRRDPNYRDVKDRIAALQPRATSPSRAVNDSDEFEDVFGNLFDSK